MPKNKLYLYSTNLRPQKDMLLAQLVINQPISKFKRTKGCTDEFGTHLLTPKNIGKKFILEGLDPVHFGIVTYLGRGRKHFPFDKTLLADFSKYGLNQLAIFKCDGKDGALFSIDMCTCKVMPVGKRIENIIIEKKVGNGVGASMAVYLIQTDHYDGETTDISIRKIGTLKFCNDNVWVVSGRKRTKNLKKALEYAKKKYPRG